MTLRKPIDLPAALSSAVPAAPILLFLLVLPPLTGPLGAQDLLDQFDDSTPVWVIFEKGKEAYDRGEFGDALGLFREARRREEEGKYPEAEYWIGIIYEEEGELELAAEQYRRALELRSRLSVPSMVYGIRYRLINLYHLTGQMDRFVQANNQILTESPLYGKPENIAGLHHQMLETFLQEGLDYTLVLYRPELTFEKRALRNLAFHHLREGQDQAAVFKMMVLTANILATAIRQYRTSFPDYKFTQEPGDSSQSRSRALLERLEKRDELKSYITRSDFFQILYYWGSALYAAGQSAEESGDPGKAQLFYTRASDVWFLCSDQDSWAGTWGRRALAKRLEPGVDREILPLQ